MEKLVFLAGYFMYRKLQCSWFHQPYVKTEIRAIVHAPFIESLEFLSCGYGVAIHQVPHTLESCQTDAFVDRGYNRHARRHKRSPGEQKPSLCFCVHPTQGGKQKRRIRPTTVSDADKPSEVS